jgi:hypothetical protein
VGRAVEHTRRPDPRVTGPMRRAETALSASCGEGTAAVALLTRACGSPASARTCKRRQTRSPSPSASAPPGVRRNDVPRVEVGALVCKSWSSHRTAQHRLRPHLARGFGLFDARLRQRHCSDRGCSDSVGEAHTHAAFSTYYTAPSVHPVKLQRKHRRGKRKRPREVTGRRR